jgi:zinc protease
VLRLAVNAGSILEKEEQRGIAHFVEHMAFNGTESFGKDELVDYFELIGMRYGPEVNAHTSFDETVYKLSIPTHDSAIIDKSFRVLKEWADSISFDPAEIDRERGVIIEEWRLGRGAEARMQEQYFPILFEGSRYAQRLPIGEKTVIETCGRADLTEFYQDWYRPDLMSVVAVGDFDKEKIEQTIKNHFISIERREDPPKRIEYEVPGHKETLYAVATDREATNTLVKLLFKHKAEPNVTIADYRESITRHLYNRMLSRRLDELVHSQDPPFILALSSYADIVRTKSLYQLACITEENGIEKGLSQLVTEAMRVKQFGFTSGELERAKEELLTAYESAFREREKTESSAYARECIDHFFKGEAIPGIAYEYGLYKHFLPEISPREVHDVASDLITEENRVVVITGPEEDQEKTVEIPEEKELAAVLSEAAGKKLSPYRDDVSEEPLMSEKPVPGSVVSETVFPEIGVHQWRLSNGITVFAKSTTFKNDQVLFTAFSPGGTSQVSDEEYWSAYFASSIINTSGLADFSLVQLEKLLSGENVSVSPYIAELTEGLSGSGSPEDLETLFKLIHLYITSPRKDESAYTSYMKRIRGYIRNRTARPEYLFQDAIQSAISRDHLRRRPLSVETLDKVELETAYRIYQERFADTDDFTFVFTGAFSVPLLKNSPRFIWQVYRYSRGPKHGRTMI